MVPGRMLFQVNFMENLPMRRTVFLSMILAAGLVATNPNG